MLMLLSRCKSCICSATDSLNLNLVISGSFYSGTTRQLIGIMNSDSEMKQAGITIKDATFVYHPEKNIEEERA